MMNEPCRHCLKGASLALYANIWNVKVTLEGSGLKNEKLLIVCWKLQIFTKNEIHIRTILMKTVFCNRCQVPCTLHKQKIHQAIWTRCRKVTWKELWESRPNWRVFVFIHFQWLWQVPFWLLSGKTLIFRPPLQRQYEIIMNYSFPTTYGMASFENFWIFMCHVTPIVAGG